MTKVFRILQLKGLGLPQGEIASSCAVSKSTVSKVLKKASELGIALPLSPAITEEQITQLFLQSQEESSIIPTRLNRVLPDFDYIRKELKRSGVTKKRLWTEYCAKCSASGQKPFMYSQFCYLVQQDQEKHRATMHIKRKPGEQVEVDWAGDGTVNSFAQIFSCSIDMAAQVPLPASARHLNSNHSARTTFAY